MILSTNLGALFCRDCIARQPPLEFAFWCALALAASLFCLWRTRRSFLQARLIGDLPTSRVRSASQGLTELAGIARSAGTPLAAPLTGSPCLWWRYRIERHQSNGRGSSWITVEKGASEEPLELDDGSGRCLVWPDGGQLHSHRIRRWTGHQRHPRLGGGGWGGLRGPLFGTRYRYTEELIVDGDPLYVLGHFETDDRARLANTKQLQAEILRQWKREYPALLARYDRNADGELDAAEWERVRAAAASAAGEEQRRRSGQTARHQVRKPQNLPLLISTFPERRLEARLRWHAAGFALGFLVLGNLTAWLVSARLSG